MVSGEAMRLLSGCQSKPEPVRSFFWVSPVPEGKAAGDKGVPAEEGEPWEDVAADVLRAHPAALCR